MKKLMRKCKKALVIAMALILVGTSIDTSTLVVRAENATDVTEGNGELQNQPGEGQDDGVLQEQSGEGTDDDEQQDQTGETEETGELQGLLGEVESSGQTFNQSGETEIDYEDLSRLEEGEEQPQEIDFSFLEDLIIDLPEPETSVPPMGFFGLSDGVVGLADGNFEEWIDRIDLSEDTSGSLRTLYEKMEEWTDNDGIEDWLITGEKDLYTIGSVDVELDMNDQAAAQEIVDTALTNYAQYVWAITDAFDRDHPEVFWLGGASVSGGAFSNGTVGSYTLEIYLQIKTETRDMRAERYRDVDTLKAAIATMNANANTILAGAEGLDTVAKIKYFNDKLTKMNEYNTIISGNGDESLVPKDTWECVSALAGKTGEVGPVCEAYARAFKVLCDRSGIPCVLEDGDAGGGHMWNLVQVDGNWYAADVTWNDPTGGNSGAVSGYENENWLLVGSETVIGGRAFSESHITQNCPTGTLQYLNGPVLSTEKYVVTNYVASVKTTTIEEKYESFDEAFNVANAAGQGAVLKLLKSVELDKNYSVTGDFTLDLNGYEAESAYRITLATNSSLTISDGSSAQSGKLCGSGLYFIENQGGILTVTGGTVTNIQGDSNFYFLIENEGTVKVTGGTVVNVTGRGYAIYNEKGDVTVEGGSVSNTGESGSAVYSNEGAVTVAEGGEITNTGTYGDAIFNNSGKVTVDGGKVTDTGESGNAIYDNAGEVIIKSGQVSSSGKSSTTIASVGELTISGGEITNSGATDSIAIRGNDSVKISNGVVTSCSNKETILIWGTETSPATLEISGGSVSNTGTGSAITIQTHDSAIITNSVISAGDSANFSVYNVGTLTLGNGGKIQGGTETVYNLGTFTLNDGIVKGGKGHSVYNSSNGQLLMNGGTIENSATAGGAIYNGASATTVITGGTIESAGSESAIYNYQGSLSISGTPEISNTGSAPAIAQYGENLYLSGGAAITGAGTAADIEVRDNSVVGRIVLVGALTNTTAYSVGHVDWDGKSVIGAFAEGGVDPNGSSNEAYAITASDVAKFTAANTDLQVKQDTANNQLLLAIKPHEHSASVTFETPWTATSGTVTEGSYYLTEDVDAGNIIHIEGSVALCLNGHTLDMGTDYLNIASDAELVICDCSTNETGAITSEGTCTLINLGSVVLESGQIINTAQSEGQAISNEGTAIIRGGSLQCTGADSEAVLNYEGASLLLEGGSLVANGEGSVGVFSYSGSSFGMSGEPVIEASEADLQIADSAQINIASALTGEETYSLDYYGEKGGTFATAADASYLSNAKEKFVPIEEGVEVLVEETSLSLDYIKGDISIRITWEDEDDKYGLRPETVTVSVYANGVFSKEVELTAEDDWEYTIEDAYSYDADGSITYSVEFYDATGKYEGTDGPAEDGFNIIASLKEISSEEYVQLIPYNGDYDPFKPDGVDAVKVNLLHPDLEDTATIQYSTDGGNTWSTTVPKIKNVGSMSVTVKVTSPNFTKYETTVQATVKPYDISNCSIELEQDIYYYTGKEAKPAITGLTDGLGQQLPINAADIVESYENNIAVGTPAVSVSVNSSNYTGTAKTVFHIEYYNGDITILYNGSEEHWVWYAEDVVITAEGYSVKFAEDDTFADSVTVSGEGMVNVKLVFKQDGTGYITEAWDGYVFMDKTGPIFTEEGDGLTLVIPSEPSDKEITWNQLATEITYDIYANADTYARIYASDKYSSVDGLYYYLDTTGSEAALTKAQLDALREAGKFEQLPDGVFDLSLDQDGKYVIYAYAIDSLGNVSEYISSNGIVIDSTAPVVEVVEPTEEAGTLKDTEMTFKVKADEDVMIGVYLTTDYSGESQNMKISNDEYGYWESYPAGEQMEEHEDGKTYISYKVFADANETKTITITGLKPNTYYEYSVEVYDLAQNGTVVAGEEDEMEPGMYWLKEITTLKTVTTFAENPTITGTYGDKLSEMTVSQPVSTNGVAGTWSIVYAGAGQSNDMPAVGGTTAYDVMFTPEDADTYETVTVKVVPDVAKMPLTVKVDNQTRVYGEENPELTYTITEGSIVDSNYAGTPRLNIELSTEATKTSDAGTYEIIATVTNDDNYAVTVQEGTLTITQADAIITVETGKDKYNKTFGDDDFNLSGISTNSDGNISYGVIGESVSVSSIGKVVIRGAGSSTITVHVPATKNYKASETVEITITVAKADIDAVNISKNYLYTNDAQDTIDLSAYVPADAGNATYSVGAASGECEFVVAPTVDANGKLSYTVKAGAVGESAFFMATVNSDNYKSLVIKVNVALVDKTPVAEKTGSEVSLKNNTLTYGEVLSKLEFNEAVFVAEGTGEVVSGTLAWETPDYKPNVATTKATWVFTPDNEQYMALSGELAIVVEKAEQPEFNIEDLGDVEYAPDKELTITTTGGIADGEVTISVPAGNGVIELGADGKAKVIGAGTVVITAVSVDEEGNYEDATATYELTVAKAQQPELSIVPVTDASYGMEGSVWLETTGGLEGAEITFSVPEDNDVVTAVNVSGAGKSFVVPLNSGKVVITAVAVDPNGNYEDATATYELNVAPASIKADWISWLDGFTGVGTYNGSVITPGVKVYFIAEGLLTEGEDYTVAYVNNTYAYTLKEGDEGFDATKAPAVVVTGKGNYTGSATVYFVINKAENAPNMPADRQTVANAIATAGQVSLPTDWIWQEPDTALTEGGETIAVAVYNGADKGNYVKEEVYVTITRMEANVPYVSKINGVDVETIEKGWQNISDTLNEAAEGDVITVEMNGVTVLPGNVIQSIKGKNITAELNMGNGVTWVINGKDITATTVEDVDLKVELNTTNIPVEVINKITGEISTMQISLAHDGDFGYKAFMRINLDAANAGYYAQLFHYEESAKALKYITQSKIDAAGYVELPFTHASEYTIVIDDVAYQVPGSGGSSAPTTTPEPTPAPTQTPPATKLPNTADEFPLEGILLLMMVCMAAFGGTLAYGKCKRSGRR